MFAAASKRAQAEKGPAMEAKTAQAVKGGLTPLWVAKLGNGLCSAVVGGDLVAAATANGVAFLNSADGAVASKCDDDGLDDVPNVLAFASKGHVIHCGDDGCVRVVSVAGALVQMHEIKEPAAEGKRPRTAPIDHAVALSGAGFAAAAGRVVHSCRMTEASAKERAPFALEHALQLEAPVRAMCAAPPGEESWAYAIAFSSFVQLVASGAGEVVGRLSSERLLKSLSPAGHWLAAAATDGTVDLWDIAGEADLASLADDPSTIAPRPADHVLRAYCGSDGAAIGWRSDGGAFAISGKRAAVFDFTGANNPHPYRPKGVAPTAPGQPDTVPRICMSDAVSRVAWAPPKRRLAGASSGIGATLAALNDALAENLNSSELATVSDDGVVRLWDPHSPPLRKGGNGNPAEPHKMKPQFYTFTTHDAAHPSEEAKKPAALVWLRADAVAVGYFCGDVVAWRVEER